jgi:serine/threonine-protein kinase
MHAVGEGKGAVMRWDERSIGIARLRIRLRARDRIRTFSEIISGKASINEVSRLPMSMPISNGAQDSLIGRTLGNRYVVERLLGTGAMGSVYCARRIELGTPVAVKVLHPQLATDATFVQRFEREAFATSRLDHPNALRVLDFGEDDGLFYLVTEYVEAEDLLAIMEAQWPLPEERVVAILSQVLSALVAVHEVGIVHRDLKPENILVLSGTNDEGEKVDIVKVCDFGIAKVTRQTLTRSRSFAPRPTAEGVIMGTPDYMSPEQARGQAVDGRSDLYSVGVVLYYLLAGQTPFNADSAVGIALQHVSEAPVPPSRHRHVRPALDAVCLRALSKQPGDRFQTAREMRTALRRALTEGSTALALVPAPATSLRRGSTFSTSSPATLPIRDEIALHRFRENQGRRRRLALAYAAVASVTVTASAVVASRGSRTTGAVEGTHQAHAAMALVSPPTRAPAAGPPLASDRIPEAEPAMPMGEPFPASPPKIGSTTVEPPRRFAARQRPPPAARSQTHIVVATPIALPVSPVPAMSTDPVLLIRSDPWQSASPPSSASRPQAIPSGSLATSHASVSFPAVVTSAGISGAKVRVGLAHVPFLPCYQQALRSRPTEATLDTELRLSIDVGGRVVGATLSSDGNLAGLRSCIESAARGVHIRDVDTGDGSATVKLRFSPR